MRRIILLTFMLFAFAGAFAQNISVADFYLAENDLTARTHGTSEEDQNGNICALIKVKTTEKGTWTFDVGMLGVWKTEMQNAAHAAEIWVYVPFGVTWMSIQHEKLGELDHFRFPCSIDKGCTYVMKLTTGKVITIVEEEVRQQYLLFQLDPPNAILEVDDKLWSVEADGTAMKYVDFGTYKYRVRASDYSEIVGKVTVDDPNNTKIVPVKLKSNLVEVTLTVDADAEIWVNNQKKGVRTWTGRLGNGIYKIECKQDGHETTMVSKEIATEMNGEIITLPTPTPIYGSLMVESTPNLCKLYIDGKDNGTTPKSINNILVGQHEIRLTKDGYDEHRETITIAKGERKQVKATLDKNQNSRITNVSSSKNAAPVGAINGLFSVSPTKKVWFSKGNLQYKASTKTWRFAENQWDFVGNDNKSISKNYSGWIDLFGWGTGNEPTKTSKRDDSYSSFNDWGSEVGDGWRTLTGHSDGEWTYVFNTRSASTVNGVVNARYAMAKVANVGGVILFPDSYTHPTGVAQPVGINEGGPIGEYWNNYSVNDFEAMQDAGAVFLPAAGKRERTSVDNVGSDGNYWSDGFYWSSSCGIITGFAGMMSFGSYYLGADVEGITHCGYSVRLVCPAE